MLLRFVFRWKIAFLLLAAACSPAATPTQVVQPPGPVVQITSVVTVAPTPTQPIEPQPASTQAVAPARPSFPITGVEAYGSFQSGDADLIAKAGAYWIRRNGALWSEVEPQEGARQWNALASLEAELISIAAMRQQAILVVRSTPSWAQKVPGSLCGPVLVEKLPAFAQLMHDLVVRYSAPPYNVKYWELGNEPDIDPALVPSDSAFGCWGDASDPYYGGGYYAEMLKLVYPQIKQADPQAQVLVGGLLANCDPLNTPQGMDCTPSRFLEGILRTGGGDYFDGVSFHAYDYYAGPFKYSNNNWNSSSDTSGPVLVAKARYFNDVLAAYGQVGKFLLNTEAAVLCGRDGSEDYCQTQEFQHTKASYVVWANSSALAAGLRANVWFSLLGWRGSGLVDANRAPLPAYSALWLNSAQLNGAAFMRPIQEYPGVTGYEFVRQGKRMWVVWSLDGADHLVQLPTQPVEAYDLFGAPLPPAAQWTVNAAPVYLIF